MQEEIRELLPYTDFELREIYRGAMSSDGASDQPDYFSRITGYIFSGLGIIVLIAALGDERNRIFISGISLLFFLLAWPLLSGTKPLDRVDQIDLTDPEVIQVIVDHLAVEPLKLQEELESMIQGSQDSISAGLADLEPVVLGLREELDRQSQPELALMVQSRLAAAERAKDRLIDLLQALAAQLEESREAVKPLLGLREGIKRIRSLGVALDRIQYAHDLADEEEDSLAVRQAELAALRRVTSEAMHRLHQVSVHLKTFEAARDELGVLDLSQRVPAPDLEQGQERA